MFSGEERKMGTNVVVPRNAYGQNSFIILFSDSLQNIKKYHDTTKYEHWELSLKTAPVLKCYLVYLSLYTHLSLLII